LATFNTFLKTATISSEYGQMVIKRGFSVFLVVVTHRIYCIFEITFRETVSVTQNTLKTVVVARKKCFVTFHLHCIFRNVKRISKMLTLPPHGKISANARDCGELS